MNEINLNCGVYQIRNIITNVCYGGQSMRLKIRPREHWNKLKNNKHKNSYLQNSYNKHGRDSFVFEILIYCVPKDLTYYEQLFYDIDKSHGLSYNIRTECVDSNRGVKFSLESCVKISQAQKGKNNSMYGLKGIDSPNHGLKRSPEIIAKISGENHWNYGKHHSIETIEKMREVHKGINNYKIMKREVVLEILGLLDKKMSQRKIAKKLHISQSTISKAKRGFYNDIYNL